MCIWLFFYQQTWQYHCKIPPRRLKSIFFNIANWIQYTKLINANTCTYDDIMHFLTTSGYSFFFYFLNLIIWVLTVIKKFVLSIISISTVKIVKLSYKLTSILKFLRSDGFSSLMFNFVNNLMLHIQVKKNPKTNGFCLQRILRYRSRLQIGKVSLKG